jgi:hypothetical protein
VPVVLAVYTGIWLLLLSPWREFWPGLILNPYLLLLYFGFMGLVGMRIGLVLDEESYQRKLRWLELADKAEEEKDVPQVSQDAASALERRGDGRRQDVGVNSSFRL